MVCDSTRNPNGSKQHHLDWQERYEGDPDQGIADSAQHSPCFNRCRKQEGKGDVVPKFIRETPQRPIRTEHGCYNSLYKQHICEESRQRQVRGLPRAWTAKTLAIESPFVPGVPAQSPAGRIEDPCKQQSRD